MITFSAGTGKKNADSSRSRNENDLIKTNHIYSADDFKIKKAQLLVRMKSTVDGIIKTMLIKT